MRSLLLSSMLSLPATAQLKAVDKDGRIEIHDGNPFVNFNPVVKESIVLKDENREVSGRACCLIMVDREIHAQEADKLWQEFAGLEKWLSW